MLLRLNTTQSPRKFDGLFSNNEITKNKLFSKLLRSAIFSITIFISKQKEYNLQITNSVDFEDNETIKFSINTQLIINWLCLVKFG